MNFLKVFVAAGAGSVPILFFGLTELSSQQKREFAVEVDFQGKEVDKLNKSAKGFSSSRNMYQGYPVGGICFSTGLKPDKAYAIEFREGFGTGSIWTGKSTELKNYIVVVEKELKLDWTGSGNSGYWSRQLENVDKYWAFVYESSKGVGIMLLEQGSPVNNTPSQPVTSENLHISTEEMNNKKVSVRRSVIGVWGEQELNGDKKCKKTSLREGQPIYRGYGMLNFDGMPKSGVWVLDWIFLGEKGGVKFNEGQWVNTERDGKKGIGRYDYFEGVDTIQQGYLTKWSDLRVNAEGISNGQGNHIKWNSQFKPSFSTKLKK